MMLLAAVVTDKGDRAVDVDVSQGDFRDDSEGHHGEGVCGTRFWIKERNNFVACLNYYIFLNPIYFSLRFEEQNKNIIQKYKYMPV